MAIKHSAFMKIVHYLVTIERSYNIEQHVGQK